MDATTVVLLNKQAKALAAAEKRAADAKAALRTSVEATTGPQGTAGTNGAHGRNGSNGLDGAKGDKGDKGEQGEQGPAGVDGIDGTHGVDGADGTHVTEADIDFDNRITFNMSDGTELVTSNGLNLEEAIKQYGRGPAGSRGPEGPAGGGGGTDPQTAINTEAIALNTAKVGITPAQAANIVTTLAKISYTDAAVVAANTQDILDIDVALGLVQTSVGNNTTAISNNDTDIGILTGSVVQNTTDIGTNTTNIGINKGKVEVSGNDTTPAYLEDKIQRGFGIIKSVENEGGDEHVKIQLGPHYLSLASTGLYTGCELTLGTVGTVNVAAGEALFVDSTAAFPTVAVQGVVIPSATNLVMTYLASALVTYLSYNHITGYVQQTSRPTAQDRRENTYIGAISHPDNATIFRTLYEPEVALDVSAQVQDIMAAIGIMGLEGNVLFPSIAGAALEWDKSQGKIFRAGANFEVNPKDPHSVTTPATTSATFVYRNQGGVTDAPTTLIDPTTYDNNGVTTSLSSNKKASIQYVYLFAENTIVILRGQTQYKDFNKAIDGVPTDPMEIDEGIRENGLLIATLVMRQNCTDLSDTTKCVILRPSKFGESGTVGSSSTTTMQDAYDNASEPEILTNAILGALTVRRGSAADTDNVLETQNNAATNTFEVTGEGVITAASDIVSFGGDIVATAGTFTGDGTGLTGVITTATLKSVAAASADFADFQTRIAAL